MDALLYQFSVSHYCEKARWALDHKGVRYQVKNLMPGLHQITLRHIVKKTTLPVLKIDGEYIQGSDLIIDHLDRTIATNSLTPIDSKLKSEAKNWEIFSANHIAIPYAVFHYSNLLKMPDLLRQRYTQNAPWYGRLFYAVAFPYICQRIRELYNITQDSADQARETIESAVKVIEQHLLSRSYLVGDNFTRADLSVAALLSPLAMPTKLNYHLYKPYPAITEFRDILIDSPAIQWVNWVYQTHR